MAKPTRLRSLIARFPFARLALALLLCGAASVPARAQQSALTPDRLKEALQRYPDADTNHDGVLSESEALAYLAKLRAGRSGAANSTVAPAPTLADVHYGPHERNVLDFWRASSDRPAPVVIYIHGGGFVAGDKSKAREERLIQQCLDAGVSFAAINYRYLSPAAPMQDVLHDCARAVQYIRSKAAEWNVDKSRIASYGVSAGAGTSMWLAFHDDLADPKNPDPVLRESSRLVCAASISGQFSYDFERWKEIFGAEIKQRFGGQYNSPELYGFQTEAELLGPAGQKVRADCDMLGLISKDDPPVFISSSLPGLELANTNQFLHHPKHSQLLYARCREVGVPVVANIPALNMVPARNGPANWHDFLFQYLGVSTAPAFRAPASVQ